MHLRDAENVAIDIWGAIDLNKTQRERAQLLLKSIMLLVAHAKSADSYDLDDIQKEVESAINGLV